MKMNRSRIIQILLLIILLGLSLRITRYYLRNNIDWDSVAYVAMANHIAKGEMKEAIAIRPEVPLLHVTAIAFLEKYFDFSPEDAGVFLGVITGSLVILAIFLIASLIFNEKIALAAAFLGAIQFRLVNDSSRILREMPALCFMLFGLYFILSALKKHSWWKWCVAGILTGICTLIRPEGIELFVAIPAWLLISFIFYSQERKNILAKCLPGLILFAVLFFVVVLPAQIYFQQFGSTYTPLLSAKMLKIYMGI